MPPVVPAVPPVVPAVPPVVPAVPPLKPPVRPGIGNSELAGLGMASVLCFPMAFDWMLKSKSTPICSKKSSVTSMNRTSTETWRSCSRRSCRSRLATSSWISAVWRMIRLIERVKGMIAPIGGPGGFSALSPPKPPPMP